VPAACVRRPAFRITMIVLFTDFGADDIYVAQVKAVLHEQAPAGTAVLDLLHRAHAFDVRAGAHLLAALTGRFPPGSVFVAVIDPGVGSERDGAVVEADGRWFVGPDNGLLSVVAARAAKVRTRRIVWRPPALSASFHGRDVFAPIAARLASGDPATDATEPTAGLQVRLDPGDLAEVVYVDHYGNALTGLRAGAVPPQATLTLRGHEIAPARVFSDVAVGTPFWYVNSIGLVEVAVNRDSAARRLGIGIGERVGWQRPRR
jgi:S-adenosylmethionine hydrolase